MTTRSVSRQLRRPFGIFIVGGLSYAGCIGDNVVPCRDFVVAHNEAYEDCGLLNELDEQELCPESLNDGRDCADYYEILADSYACENEQVIYSNEGTERDDECDVR